MLQTPGQVAQQPFGLVCVVLVPGLTERLLDARMQMQGQALGDVTALVDLAALDGGGHTEGVADRFAECLRAIDDEQPGQRRIESPGEEIVEQGLGDDSVLRRPPAGVRHRCARKSRHHRLSRRRVSTRPLSLAGYGMEDRFTLGEGIVNKRQYRRIDVVMAGDEHLAFS